MKIIKVRGDTPEILEDVVKRCHAKDYSIYFLDRLTMMVDNSYAKEEVCLWFGAKDGMSKTVALNKLDKELCDGEDTRG